MTPERKLQGEIVAAINKAPLGAWAVPNIVVKKARKAHVEITGLGTGSPDVYVAIAPVGHLWLEVKCRETSGALSEEQKIWHEKARAFGVTVVVVRSVREALEAVMKARRDALELSALAAGGSIAAAAGKALVRCLQTTKPLAPLAPLAPLPPLDPLPPLPPLPPARERKW